MKRCLPLHAAVLVWMAAVRVAFPEQACPPGWLPNPCFEAVDDVYQPLDWELHADRPRDLVSAAWCSASPVGESVLRITGAPVPADDHNPILARVDADFVWNPQTERLTLQFHYRRVAGQSVWVPVRFRVEIGNGVDEPATLDLPIPGGIHAPDTNVWYQGHAGSILTSPDQIEGPVNIVGFQIQRSTASLPPDAAFYLDGLSLTNPAMETATVVPFPYPATGDDLIVELPLIDWGPGIEVTIGEGEHVQSATEIVTLAGGIMAVFDNLAVPPGWQPLLVDTGGGEPIAGGPVPVYPPAWIDGLDPATGSTDEPTAVVLAGGGFTHGMQGDLGGEPIDLIVESSGIAQAIFPPLPAGPHEFQATLPWDRLFDGAGTFLSVTPPLIGEIDPTTGSPEGGQTVTVYGAGFEEGATVFFDQLAAETEYVSPNELRAIVPPSVPFYAQVSVDNPGGITGVFEGSYRYVGRPAGDFDGDGIVDQHDLAVALRALVGHPPPVPVAVDLDGDGRIGLEDAHLLLQRLGLRGVPNPFLDDPPAPVVSPVDSATVRVGETLSVVVTNVPFGEPVRLWWGDGTYDDVHTNGVWTHAYERSGTFDMRFSGETNGIEIAVEPISSLVFEAIELQWQPPLETCILYLANDDPVPEGLGIELSLRGAGSGPFEAEIVVVRHTPDQEAQTETIPIIIEMLDLIPGTPVHIPLTIDPDLATNSTLHVDIHLRAPSLTEVLSAGGGVGPTLTAVRRFVTPGDCENTRRELEERLARLAACRERCDALAQRLAQAIMDRDGLVEQRDAVVAARDDSQARKDDIQTEYDTLFGRLSRYFNSFGMTLVAYPVGTPAHEAMGNHGNFIGRYRRGADQGIGIAFDGLGALRNATSWYDHFGPPTLGQNLGKLRLWLREIVEHQQQIDDLNQEILHWEQKIDDADAVIAEIEAELADCLDQCDALQADIDDLVAAHGECLEQLERQRRAQDKIDRAAGEGERAEKDRQRLRENADRADDFIDERAGSPAEAQPDRDNVQEGRNHGHDAEDEIRAGRAKLEEARAKLADGLTEEAELLVEQARGHFEAARNRARDGNRSLNRGLSGAGRRPRKVCEDGQSRTGVTGTRSVWTDIEDFHITPRDSTPEQYDRQLKNKDNILQGLRDLMRLVGYLGKLQDATGVNLPLGGTSVSDPVGLAESIVDAYLDLFRRHFPMTVWIDVSGYTAWSRIDWLCVHGRWESETVTGRYDGTITGRLEIGTIWGGDREDRQKQLELILSRFMRQNNIKPDS